MKSGWNTRQTLLMRAKNQDDSKAWEDFVEYYTDFIKIILSQLSVNSNDKEDLTQEILLKIWKSLKTYEDQNYQFRSWLKRLIRNNVIDYIRKKTRQDRLSGDSINDEAVEVTLAVSEDEFAAMVDKEWRTYLTNRAMKNIEANFSENAISAFKLSLQDISVKEITSKLNLAEGSVYTLRKRVQQSLLDEVKRLKNEVEF